MTISLHPLVWTFDAASGPNGQNSLLRVRINRRAVRGVAVLAQELAEHWAKRRWLGLPWLWSRRSEAARIAYDEALELQGHAVEIEVAVALLRKDRALVLHAEAHALTAPGTSYRRKSLFEGLDADDLRLMLEARRGEAAGWLARHRTTLERVAARIGLA